MNEIIQTLNEFGHRLATWLLWMNGWTLAILAAAIVLDGLLARHVAARWRLLLYAAVFLRLALPVSWQSPLALQTPYATPSDFITHAALEHAAPTAPPQLSDASLVAPVDQSTAIRSSSSVSITAVSWSIVPIVYVVGVIVLSIIWIRTRIAMRRLLQHATLAPRVSHTESPNIPQYIHETFGPAVVGIFRPCIILPARMIHPNNADESQTHSLIIQHERAHITNGDHLIAPLLQLIVIVAWPIISLWFAAARIRRLMEIACDERALQAAPSHLRCAYVQHLLSLAARQQSRYAAVLPLLGLKGEFAARLAAIASPPARRCFTAAQALLIAMACTALLACSTTSSQNAGKLNTQSIATVDPLQSSAHPTSQSSVDQPKTDPIHLTDRTVLIVSAWDTDQSFTENINTELVCFNKDPFWPMQTALPFQITIAPWHGAPPALNPNPNPNQTPLGKQLRDWLHANATERMLPKPGTKVVLNNSPATFKFPHIASGGDDVERSEMHIHLGETSKEPVHFTYQMPDRPAREQFPRWHMTLQETSDGTVTLLAMPLANGGRRIILIERQPYIHPAKITPQRATAIEEAP